MTDLLTIDQAAELCGVPPEQLKRWAWESNRFEQHGPKNSGTRNRPRYLVEDVRAWRHAADQTPR